jgi:hypothetical protein
MAVVAAAAPPKVIKAVPENGAATVDPQLKELRIVFDQAMSQDGHSVVGGGPKFPKFVGKRRWENDRTFVWSWQLEPEYEYWLSINSDRFTNFRNLSDELATPYPISFRTAKGSTTSPATRHRDAVAHLKRAILEDYSYFDSRGVNWEERFVQFSPRLEAAGSAREFADIAAELLAPTQDIHLWLKVDGKTVGTFQRSYAWNGTSRHGISNLQKHNATVSTGMFKDGTRYVSMRTWPIPQARDELEPAFALLKECNEAGRPLIVDVRANGGGSEITARQFAGCFIDRRVAYAKHAIRRDGKFSDPQVRELQPNKDRPPFTNRVAVLMGQGTVSSCESFVMMMKKNPRCTLIGDYTAGASGNPQPVDLGNGVTVYVPSWKDMDLGGVCFEGKGVAPDHKVMVDPMHSRLPDPVIAAALQLLRK